MNKISVYSLTSHEWIQFFSKIEASSHVAEFWLRSFFKNKIDTKHNISQKVLELVDSKIDFTIPKINRVQTSEDQTIKFQMAFQDGLEVETVLIPFKKRYTVCLSTQVGCAMNCSFCFTGTQGLKRNLRAHEIVGQYVVARNYLLEKNRESIHPRIVFMGQGEPLHNFEETKKAIEILTDKQLFHLGPKEITLSTAGYLPGLKRASELPKLNFALSLHSPFNEERKRLIPISGQFPLSSVIEELDGLSDQNNSIITYEYLLIKNFNMTTEHITELEKLLSRRRAVLNLIPFNPFPGASWEKPSSQEIEEFKEQLVKKKLRVFIRTTKGDEILAACGQLKIDRLSKGQTHEL